MELILHKPLFHKQPHVTELDVHERHMSGEHQNICRIGYLLKSQIQGIQEHRQ